jgi:hypothetical protein
MHSPILAPVVALVAWTLAMLFWLVLTRAPAMRRAGIDIRRVTGSVPGQLDRMINPRAQWPAHNYMHLVEQPTLFYAICGVLALSGAGAGAAAALAWAYVALRVAHSLVQALYNRVIVRFYLFAASTAVLVAMTALAGLAVTTPGG